MKQEIYTGNPLIKHKFTADPTVIYVDNRFYLYCGHDEAPVNTHDYHMNEWLCFSSTDLADWTEHYVDFHPQVFKWGKCDAYASKVIHARGKFFWFAALTPIDGAKKAIGVAVSDSPTGKFVDLIGKPLIWDETAMFQNADNFDPSVLIDDGTGYIFWGKNVCLYASLNHDLSAIDSEIRSIDLPDFMEGVHVHKRNAWYYLSYGYGFPEKVGYAMSRSIHGPWKFMGVLNEIAGNCETNRPAVIDMPDQSYFFYHNGSLPQGGSHRRSICVDYLHYEPDGRMKKIVMSSEGVRLRQ